MTTATTCGSRKSKPSSSDDLPPEFYAAQNSKWLAYYALAFAGLGWKNPRPFFAEMEQEADGPQCLWEWWIGLYDDVGRARKAKADKKVLLEGLARDRMARITRLHRKFDSFLRHL